MNKLIRDGQVAILVSPGYGSGWSTWNKGHGEAFLFDPEIVQAILDNDRPKAKSLAKAKYPGCYIGTNLNDLEVQWLPQGTHFRIAEYDGYESVELYKGIQWSVA